VAIVNKTTKQYYLQLPVILLILFFAASGGTLYDIIFSLALIKCIEIISSNYEKINARYLNIQIIFWILILDLSRPVGIYFSLPLLLIILLQRKIKGLTAISFIIVCIIFLHGIQYTKFNTPLFTTYKGENLAEVFNGERSRNCLEEFGRKNIDTVSFSDCSNQISNEIISNLIASPQKLTAAFSPHRLNNLFFPDPFWGKAPSKWDAKIALTFHLLLTLFYLHTFIYYRLNFGQNVAIVIFIAGVTLTLMGHNLTETIRVFMPYQLVLALVALQPRMRISK
jgi:hypothetical protein